jgi:hypothetical protein
MWLRGVNGLGVEATAGWRLREAVRVGVASKGGAWGGVVPVVGAPNAYAALLAERAGLPLLYLSGSTLSASSFGCPPTTARFIFAQHFSFYFMFYLLFSFLCWYLHMRADYQTWA